MYQITSKAGADFGRWPGASPAEALAAMHREAGIDCQADGARIVFLSADDELSAGQPDAWIVKEAT